MPAILSKNCILIGELDLYCLACSVHLMSEDDALGHIQDLKHKEVIGSIEYIATHEQDLIRKVNGVYFCEVCNISFSTFAKLKVHVTEDAHLLGKRRSGLKRAGNGGVFAGDVFISESAWHGLVEDTCVLCNVECVDVTAHKFEKTHIINLISNKVIFTANIDLYRKVEDIYQCLTCNQVISAQLLTEHLNSEEHKKRFIFIKDFPDIIEQREEGNTESQKTSPKKVSEQENTIKSASKAMEQKEETTASSSCVCLHTDNEPGSSDAKKQNPVKKVPMDEYLREMQMVSSYDGVYFIFYDSLCIDSHLFMGLTGRLDRVICRFCDIDVTETIPSHLASDRHYDLLINSTLVTSMQGELVRQVKADMYDCGYCGEVRSDYIDMLDHLATAEHKSCRVEHENKLQELKAMIAIGGLHHIKLKDCPRMNATMFRNMFLFNRRN